MYNTKYWKCKIRIPYVQIQSDIYPHHHIDWGTAQTSLINFGRVFILSFLLCKTGILVIPTPWDCLKN